MKKILLFTAAALALTVPAAFAADDTAAPAKKEGPGKHRPRLEMLDTNKDGKISKDEFLAPHISHFAKLDTNGDGFATKEEIEARRAEWQEKKKEKMEQKAAEEKTKEEAPAEEKAPE